MVGVDLALIQLQYEIFHEKVEDLALEYDTTPRMIEFQAESRGWKRSLLTPLTTEIDHTSKESLEASISENTSLLKTIKQAALNPKYIALETAILGKCLTLVKNLQADDPTTAGALKAISEIFKSLKETTQGKVEAEQASESKGFQVIIQNRIGALSGPEPEPIEVSIGSKGLLQSE